jgi:CheY-like chemotaxis protein
LRTIAETKHPNGMKRRLNGMKWIKHRPDLVLLDVQMPEVSGFDVLRGLTPDGWPPTVIFVTAHD